jgi:hypothetical protein
MQEISRPAGLAICRWAETGRERKAREKRGWGGGGVKEGKSDVWICTDFSQ